MLLSSLSGCSLELIAAEVLKLAENATSDRECVLQVSVMPQSHQTNRHAKDEKMKNQSYPSVSIYGKYFPPLQLSGLKVDVLRT